MFLLNDKGEVLDFTRKKEKHAEAAKIYSKNKVSICEIVKKKKKSMQVLQSHYKL